MIQYELTINKENVLTEVMRVTSYEGYRGGGSDEAYEKMYAREEDAEALERYYEEAFERLRATMDEYIIGEPIDSYGEEQTITLNFPDNYNEAMESALRTSAVQYMVESVAADWFSIVEKDNAEAHASAASAALKVVRGCLHKRVRPARPS